MFEPPFYERYDPPDKENTTLNYVQISLKTFTRGGGQLRGVQHTGTFASHYSLVPEEMSVTRIVPVTKNLPLLADFAQDCHASRNPWSTQLNVFPRTYMTLNSVGGSKGGKFT